METKDSKFLVFWLILLFCVIKLEFGNCYKCDFEDFYSSYICNTIPDSSSIEEKHLEGKTDDNVRTIYFNGTRNGISHLTHSELTPICQRFKNVLEIRIYDIKSVDENLFQGCENLTTAWITDSEIEEIPEKLFFEQPQLTSINLEKIN